MLESELMRLHRFALLILVFAGFAFPQNPAQKVYETERAFEKMAAEKGLNAAFVEFMAPTGIMFVPDARNGREFWKNLPASPAALTWNPIWIDVASNGTLAYSIGNSIRRPKGKDDSTEIHGHYISVWSRQPNGEYLAVLDAGINHDKPASIPTDWKSPADSGSEKNEGRLSAADSAVGFYQAIDTSGSIKAYKTYLTNDAILMRSGKQPFFGKKASMDYLEETKPRIKFAKRKAFIEAPDIAYVHNVYAIVDKAGTEIERGNFVQVWKLRKGKWLIAVDALIASPKQN